MWLLAGVAVVGIAWALLVPAFQAPDEDSHFAYAQSLVERGDLPGDATRRPLSTEQEAAINATNADQAPALVGQAANGSDTARALVARTEWSEAAYDRWRSAEEALPDSARSDGGGPVPSAGNPPLYFLYQAPAYAAASAGDLFDRLYVMRLWSVALLLVTTVGAWLLAGELFGRDRLLQLVAAAVAGLQPMVVFMSSSVNPDAMLYALWSLSLWLGVRVLKYGLARDCCALLGLVGLAVVTKATSYALVPAALFALVVAAVRRGGARRRTAAVLVAAVLALALPVGTWLGVAGALDRPAVNRVATEHGLTLTSFSVRDLGSYLWQFYLPRLPFQERFGGMPQLPAYNVWLKAGLGCVRLAGGDVPARGLRVARVVTAGDDARGARVRAAPAPGLDLAVAAFFAIAAAMLLAGLHWTEFRTLTGGSGAFNQGRYLLPLIALGGAAVAATVALVPERLRAPRRGRACWRDCSRLQLFSLGARRRAVLCLAGAGPHLCGRGHCCASPPRCCCSQPTSAGVRSRSACRPRSRPLRSSRARRCARGRSTCPPTRRSHS